MKRRLRTKVWWPKIDTEAENLVKSCQGCTLVSGPSAPEPMKRRELPSAPWLDVAVDFLGPLPTSDFLFVIVDYYSRYKEIEITRNTSASFVINALKKMFTHLGYSHSITADNGPQFQSSEFKDFCKENGIKIFHTIPYWPQQNGEVERQNRDILKRIKISKALGRNWKSDLQIYLLMYYNTPHSVTGRAPSELMFGRLLRDKIPSASFMKYYTDDETRDKDKIEKEKGKEYADRKRNASEDQFIAGDTVLLRKRTKGNKFAPTYDQVPHTIVNKKGGDALIQNNISGNKLRANKIHLKKVSHDWTIVNNSQNNKDEEDLNKN